MRQPRKPDPEVMESDYRVPTALGTAAWVVALVVLLAMGDQLAPDDRWWRWVCLTGIAFGIFAFVYIPRHLRRAAESGSGGAPDDTRLETDTAKRRLVRSEGDRPAGDEAAAADGSTPPTGDGTAPPDASADPPAADDGDPGGDTRA